MERYSEEFRSQEEEKEEYLQTDEEVFQRYFYELDLKPEDFEGKILDVGSGSWQFAKYAKEHGVSSEIYSLDYNAQFQEKTNAVQGLAQKMPFKDEQFNLVVSYASVPRIFANNIEYPDMIEENIRQGLSEMLRVVRKGEEVRFGPIVNGEGEELERTFREILNEVLKELQIK